MGEEHFSPPGQLLFFGIHQAVGILSMRPPRRPMRSSESVRSWRPDLGALPSTGDRVQPAPCPTTYASSHGAPGRRRKDFSKRHLIGQRRRWNDASEASALLHRQRTVFSSPVRLPFDVASNGKDPVLKCRILSKTMVVRDSDVELLVG